MTSIITDPQRAVHVADILKALAHPLRIRIVALLVDGPLHVSSLADKLGAKQSIISQQLRILRMRGLVVAVRQDGYAHYHIAEPQLVELVRCMESCSVR